MRIKLLLVFFFSLWGATSFAALPVPAQVAPQNMGIDRPPNTLIDWGSSTGQTYYEMVYGTDPLLVTATQTVTPTTTSFATSNLLFGTVYYWKVRAMSATDSSAWSATWQFTTLNSITYVSPANGGTQQPVDALLDWLAVSGIDYYEYQADTSANFNSGLFQTGLAAASQANLSELHFNETYYWRLRGMHAADTTQWTPVLSFSTLNGVSLVAPTNASINQVCNVLLDWSATSGLTFYDYEYDTSSQFNSPNLFYGSVTSSQVNAANLLFGTQYFWRVRLRHGADTSSWSAAWNFTTLDQITLISPAIGATNQVADQLIDWSATTGLTYYEYEADLTTNFNSPNLVSGLVTASQVNLIILLYDTVYYWRVRGLNLSDTTQWSPVWNFSTMASLTLVGPANGSTMQAPNALIDWSATSGFSFYDYQADTSPGFSSPNLQQGSVSASQVNLANCLFGQVYYWRARARHSTDTMEWSQAWSMTIVDQLTQVSPANGATSVAVNPLIDWSALAGISSYEMCLDDDAQFGSAQCFSIGSGSSQQSVSGLAYGETYYWKVRAIHSSDTSAWSPVWSFTTSFQLTTGPVLNSPADLSTNLPTSITLDWGSVAGALTYQWQVAENNQFVNAIFGTTSSLTAPVNGLQNSTIYFWRVRANNGAGFSPWSTAFTFSTIAGSFNTPPVLMSPSDLSTGLPLSVNFSWGSVSGALSYEFALDSSNIFSNPFTSTITAAGLNVSSLDYSTQYYWRVRAYDGSNFSPWSVVYTFSTMSNPFSNAPFLLSPADLSANLPVSLNLVWNTYPGATIFEYQYDTDPFFAGSTAIATANNTENISALQYNTTYYWRVRAGDGNVFSSWSQTRSFSTEANPLFVSPQLFFPADLATGINVNLSFQWASVPSAVSYQIEYDLDGTFSAPTLGSSATNSFSVNGLNYDTTYYWRVRAFDGTYFTPWSTVSSFTTEPVVTGLSKGIAESVTVYPNPTNDFVSIDLGNLSARTDQVFISNIFGQVVWTTDNFEQKQVIRVSLKDFPSGVYYLAFKREDGSLNQVRIIKQ